MRKQLNVIICFFTINMFVMQASLADSNSPIPIGDADSVPDMVAHISATLEEQGFTVILVVDHAAAANSVGLDLAPTQVIFARQPRFQERQLLRRSNTAGIDLPLKFLVFEEDGLVLVTFNPVGYLVDRHDIKFNDHFLKSLKTKVQQFSVAPNGLITIESAQTLEDTVASLHEAISSNPAFRIPLVLDYDADWKHTHHNRKHRRKVLIVFGNPNAGTPLIQAEQRIGIDLPQKFLVWEDFNGRVNISYNDPFFFAARHNIQNQDARLKAISNALHNFAQKGAGIDSNAEN